MKNNQIIYSLTVEDIQIVANKEIERDLTQPGIEKIIEAILEKINWYDAIADSIYQKETMCLSQIAK